MSESGMNNERQMSPMPWNFDWDMQIAFDDDETICYPDFKRYPTFRSLVQYSKSLFSTDKVHERAVNAALLHNDEDLTLNASYINNISNQFIENPFQCIENVMHQNESSRITSEKLNLFKNINFNEFDQMMESTIKHGVSPVLSDSFIPNVNAAKIRPSMEQIQPVLNLFASKMVNRGETMILPYNVFLDTVKKYNLTTHLSEIHQRR